MKDLTFLERIREIGRMTPSEARIAEHMEDVYPMVALETITTICTCANVGRATVVRFIQKLGYKSYYDFQRDLHSEIIQRLQPPAANAAQRSDAGLFRRHCDQTIRNINEAANRNKPRLVNKTARILARCKGDIYIMGHRTSFALASFFHYQLSYLRDGVRLCSNFWGELPNFVSQVTSDDLLFLFFNSRYSRLSETVAQWFARHGCGIILLADREVNPLSHLATLQLVAPSEGIGFFESRVATFAVFETLSNLVAVERMDQLKERFEKFEDATNVFGVFSEWWKNKPKRPKALKEIDPARSAAGSRSVRAV
ncbi:MAG: MurR/RpiR family transcriptional regulator [Desulfobacterales bacterium]|jgi:DNA-binding MurR/RpiR family transcriptional regulator|nr:MurR/RpiR family transcriptional regulator [Desulfobacterales bacterium]